jgi:hypothetical protein
VRNRWNVDRILYDAVFQIVFYLLRNLHADRFLRLVR